MFAVCRFKSFQWFCIGVLILGIGFRFVNLDRKVYWYDEVVTSVRLAGYTKSEFSKKFPINEFIKVEDLQNSLHIQADKGLRDTLQSLAIETPQHPPLYYGIARLWVGIFGDSITAVRGLSALLSLFLFPCAYWLCLELFNSSVTAGIAVALMAVSPLTILYAQEARQYSLWSVTILLSSALLLRSQRLQTPTSWFGYGIATTLSLYSHLLASLVIFAQGIYLLVTEGFRLTKNVIAYCLAILGTILAFLPWFLLLTHYYDDSGWVNRPISVFSYIQRFIFNLSSVFIDLQLGCKTLFYDILQGQDEIQLNPGGIILLSLPFILALIVYSLNHAQKNLPHKARLFLFINLGISFLPWFLKDIISGGQRASIARYLIPTYLFIQILVADLLANKLFTKQKKVWQLITIGLILGGILSNSVSLVAQTWWNKYSGYYNPQAALIINQSHPALVISSNPIRLASLSYLLDSNTTLMISDESKLPLIPSDFDSVFLFQLHSKLEKNLSQDSRYSFQLIFPGARLWKLIKSS